ncbi:MAG: membrane protein insertion efficiency factor YidD [Anaerolineales bacterium]|nr:membrane protein insertion efficiency factor YidD [Anaerolineales bacterium]
MDREFYLPSDYSNEPRLREHSRELRYWPRLVFLALIRVYQKTVSRGLPEGTCRFYPSCSHYGYQAIYKYGILKGFPMAVWRILRCNPFNPGGYDPVPEETKSPNEK